MQLNAKDFLVFGLFLFAAIYALGLAFYIRRFKPKISE